MLDCMTEQPASGCHVNGSHLVSLSWLLSGTLLLYLNDMRCDCGQQTLRLRCRRTQFPDDSIVYAGGTEVIDVGGDDMDDGGNCRDGKATSRGDGTTKTGAPPTVEATIYEYMQGLVDDAHCIQADSDLHTRGGLGAALRAHISTLFRGNTEDSTRTKIGDWVLFLKLTYAGRIPPIIDVQWPPTEQQWGCTF